MNKDIITAENLIYKYPDAEKAAVNDVSFTVREGEFLAILGRNGSGKSTLAKLLNALILPDSGTLIIDGCRATSDDPFSVRERCGMVFQNPDNQIVATMVEEDCAFGLENLGVPSGEIRVRVDAALAEVGMTEKAKQSPSMLSGGQKQRVAIAGVLAMKPKIIIFDESTAMLDPMGRKDVLSIAQRLNREDGITVAWITHFMEEAVQADRVFIIDSGRIALTGAPVDVFPNVEQILEFGLDVPEMMKLAFLLNESGIKVRNNILTIEEMAVELCRLSK